MNKYKSKVRICPFCGHHGQQLHVEKHEMNQRWEDGSYDRGTIGIYSIECKCCGARGPTEYNPRFAVDSWNCLYKKPAHDDDPVETDFECEYDENLIWEDYRKEML